MKPPLCAGAQELCHSRDSGMAIPEVLELPPGASRAFVSQKTKSSVSNPGFKVHIPFQNCFGFFSFIEVIFCTLFNALFGPPSSDRAEGDV